MRFFFIFIFIFIWNFAVSASAQDFNTGLAAYKAGNFSTALEEWEPLAEEGNPYVQYNLGIMYDYDLNDYKKAVKWYALSAAQGLNAAQFNLGIMYDYGYGVSQDFILAYLWFDLAGVNGHDDGFTSRDIIAQKMSKEDIAKAQTVAVKCLDSHYQDCGY